MFRLLISIFIGLFLSTYSFAQTIEVQETQEAAQEPLVRGDVILIEIKNVPEMSGQYSVDEQGQIDMPYVGKVTAAGQDTTTLARILEDLYIDDYLVNPTITVSIFAKVLPAKEIVSYTKPYTAPEPIIIEGNSISAETTEPTKIPN